MAQLGRVTDLQGSPNFLYDVYFTQRRIIFVRQGRKTLCRIAIGMSGAQISNEMPTVEKIGAAGWKNSSSIPYDNVRSLRLLENPKSQSILEINFPSDSSMKFILDRNQTKSIESKLTKIIELGNRLTVLQVS